MMFNDACDRIITVEGNKIPRIEKYKYLGIWIKKAENYMENYEQVLRAKGKRNATIMKQRYGGTCMR